MVLFASRPSSGNIFSALRPAWQAVPAGSRRENCHQPSAHDYPDRLHEVVAHALEVPRRIERLRSPARLSRGTRARARPASRPIERPAAPRERARPALQRRRRATRRRRRPRRARSAPAPDQARPRSVTGPGSTMRARVRKSGKPGGIISARGRIRVTGSPGSSASLLEPVGDRLLVAVERHGDRFDRASATSRASCRTSRARAGGAGSRAAARAGGRSSRRRAGPPAASRSAIVEAARVVVLVRRPATPWSAPVKTISTASGPTPASLEERRERRAGPLGGADRLDEPGLADRPRLESGAAVAGALERHRQRCARARAEVVQRERERPLDVARRSRRRHVDASTTGMSKWTSR